MKKGKCPKCGSGNVLRGAGHGPAGCNAAEFLRISYSSKAELTHYVCSTCGYHESYIEDEKSLNKIRKKWASPSHDSPS